MSRLCGTIPALVLAMACATGASTTAPEPKQLEPLDLYPMAAGNAWSYDVDSGESTQTLAVTRVERVQGAVAEVRTGRNAIWYELRAEGIFVPSEGAWLIRAPLRIGATWPARGGRTAKLVSMEIEAKTPAGTFDRCVEVLETGGERRLEVRTVYCAGVGPVAVDSTMRSDVNDSEVSVRARLRGYSVGPQSSW